jgi:hypothetical protein
MNDPLNLLEHSRGIIIEQIMALVGRSLPSPQLVRRFLEEMPTASLDRLLTNVLEAADKRFEVQRAGVQSHENLVSDAKSFPLSAFPLSAFPTPPCHPSALAGDESAAADVSELSGAASPSASPLL